MHKNKNVRATRVKFRSIPWLAPQVFNWTNRLNKKNSCSCLRWQWLVWDGNIFLWASVFKRNRSMSIFKRNRSHGHIAIAYGDVPSWLHKTAPVTGSACGCLRNWLKTQLAGLAAYAFGLWFHAGPVPADTVSYLGLEISGNERPTCPPPLQRWCDESPYARGGQSPAGVPDARTCILASPHDAVRDVQNGVIDAAMGLWRVLDSRRRKHKRCGRILLGQVVHKIILFSEYNESEWWSYITNSDNSLLNTNSNFPYSSSLDPVSRPSNHLLKVNNVT